MSNPLYSDNQDEWEKLPLLAQLELIRADIGADTLGLTSAMIRWNERVDKALMQAARVIHDYECSQKEPTS